MKISKHISFIVVIVSLTASVHLRAQVPLLEYHFNETGTIVTNSGSGTADLTLLNAAGVATDLHSAAGSGVTEALSDYAFDNRAGLTNGWLGGVAVCSVAPAALAGLRSFTLTGWVKNLSTNHKEESRLIQWATGGSTLNGFQFTYAKPNMKIYVNNAVVASVGLDFFSAFTNETEWAFCAVSWDGTLASSNVKFYLGSPSALLTPSTVTLAQTSVTNANVPFCVGNERGRARAIAGMIDDIRVFGSATDNSGALSTFQIDYLRQQTVPATNEMVYLSAGKFVNALSNLLDSDETTFVENTGNDGAVVWDRHEATPIYDFGLTSRNVPPNKNNQGPPQSWRIEVQANDDPSAKTGWSVLAAVTNVFGVSDALCNNLGRRVTFNPVTKRYIRWVNTYTGDASGIASFDIGRQVYVYASSNTLGNTYPINYATDGDSNTFANLSAWGASPNTGLLILDVLRTNRNDSVTELRLQPRVASDIFPKDYIVSVSSTDDPSNFDTVVTTGQLEQPSAYQSEDNDRFQTIKFKKQPKRFFRFEWTSSWSVQTGAQIAEIAVTTVTWPEVTIIAIR